MPDSWLYSLVLTISFRCFLTRDLIQQQEKYPACTKLSIPYLIILGADIQIALPR